jgi:hypothetical protein
MLVKTNYVISGIFRGGPESPVPYFSSKIYELIHVLVKFIIWDSKRLKYFAIAGVGALFGMLPPFSEISGSAVYNRMGLNISEDKLRNCIFLDASENK